MLKKKVCGLVLGLLSLLFLNGCGLGIMAAGIGYGISASKKGDAKVAEAEAQLQRVYNDYKLGMEQLNMEREAKGLKPQPILPIEEWLRYQSIPEKNRADLAAQERSSVFPTSLPKTQEAQEDKSKPDSDPAALQ